MKKKAEVNNGAVIYCRKSTAMQEVTLQDQEERLRAYCVAKGLAVVDVISEEVSARVPLEKRPGGKKLLSTKAGHVVALKLDRIFRNAAECLITTQEWDKAGISLHVLDMNIETGSITGRLFLTILSGVAEMEKSIIAERTRNGLGYRKAHGKVYNHVPFGYDKDGDNLVENKAEQAVITRIKRMKGKGFTYRKIAEILNKGGFKTKTGKAWAAGTIHALLGTGLHGE